MEVMGQRDALKGGARRAEQGLFTWGKECSGETSEPKGALGELG